MAHDFAAQRQGTVDSFALMGPGVPLRAMVAFQFVAEEMAPDWVGTFYCGRRSAAAACRV